MIEFKLQACRAAQRDLWDYASERLAEGPMEQIERHLATCASCRREVTEWKRAQILLETAQAAPLPAARLGWMDLQARIAADVAAFGPPRPDRRHTRQAVSQLIPRRRANPIFILRPALAGGIALTLAAVLMTHRVPKTPVNVPAAAPAAISAAPLSPLTLPIENASAFAQAPGLFSSPALSIPAEVSALPASKIAQSNAVKNLPAPNRIAIAPPTPLKSKTQKVSAKAASPKALAANRPLDTKDNGALKLKPHEPTPEEKAPDESEVADGVIGTLVPVSHDENNGYY